MRRCCLFLAPSRDPFKALGLSRTATKAQVKGRYRELAHRYHPDSGEGDTGKMEEINKAYNLLIKEGAFERLHLAHGSTTVYGDVSKSGDIPFSRDQERESFVRDKKDFTPFTEEEAEKIGALDPSTERMTPEGRYLYQNRDDGSWVELCQPLVRAEQPRYNSFSAGKELNAELLRRAHTSEREANEKPILKRTFDRLADSADLPSRNPYVFFLFVLLVLSAFYVMYSRSFARQKHHNKRASFYKSVEENRLTLLEAYENNRAGVEIAVAAAALVFLAASEDKLVTDPVVRPSTETFFSSVAPPRSHFHVIAGG